MSEFTLLLAGDALLSEPWSHVTDPAFLRLVAEMRAADASLVNLETVIHEFKGHPQADSGGIHAATPPGIARELAWAGIDAVSHANNHAFDYGSIGILETHEHVASAGLVLAGSGRDLEQARAPRYLERRGVRVALVAMASTFVPYGRASRSRADARGRPGINPLALARERVSLRTPRVARALLRLARPRSPAQELWEGRIFSAFGRRFQVGGRNRRGSVRRPNDGDAAANLAAVAQAAREADLTIVSLHAHAQKLWLPGFARDLLAAGADVVFCHGRHDLRAIELVAGKPIFYGLGDFGFQIEAAARQPAEAYEKLGLSGNATPAELVQARRASGQAATREAYEGCAAVLRFAQAGLAQIRLLPLDLRFDACEKTRGLPRCADPALGRKLIARIARRSQRFGTRIAYDAERNEGRVEIR